MWLLRVERLVCLAAAKVLWWSGLPGLGWPTLWLLARVNALERLLKE